MRVYGDPIAVPWYSNGITLLPADPWYSNGISSLGVCDYQNMWYHNFANYCLESITINRLIGDLDNSAESRALSTYPQPPKFWKRYVDDTCCALKARHIDDFHRHINTIEATIQFTVERESDAQLAFLDVLVIRNPDRTLATNVYRKPTHTDRYLDFQSNHPIAHKIAVIRPLNHRAKNFPSTPTTTVEEKRKAKMPLALVC